MNRASVPPLWIRHYGTVPAHIDYPERTLYQMIAATAARVPEAIVEHPLVAEACVAGVPDSEQIERVVAWVVPKVAIVDTDSSAQVLIAHCRAQLLKWSCPREIHFCSSLPKTRVGKIDYRSLQQQYSAGEQTPGA